MYRDDAEEVHLEGYYLSKNAKIQIMASAALCVARDLKNRMLEALLAHQRKAQKEGRGVDLHLQAGDKQTVSLHQVTLAHSFLLATFPALIGDDDAAITNAAQSGNLLGRSTHFSPDPGHPL